MISTNQQTVDMLSDLDKIYNVKCVCSCKQLVDYVTVEHQVIVTFACTSILECKIEVTSQLMSLVIRRIQDLHAMCRQQYKTKHEADYTCNIYK